MTRQPERSHPPSNKKGKQPPKQLNIPARKRSRQPEAHRIQRLAIDDEYALRDRSKQQIYRCSCHDQLNGCHLFFTEHADQEYKSACRSGAKQSSKRRCIQ
jgi:hypothetical protein